MEALNTIDDTLTHSTEEIFASEIRFLPIRMDGSLGVYHEQAVDLFKELKAQELDISWSADKEHRGWYGERSGIIELVVVPLVVGVASSAAWDALKLAFRKKESSKFKIKVFARKETDGSQDRLIEVEGTGPELAATLEKLDPWREIEDGKDIAG